MKINEKGITIIELLAALALVSIIAVAAWTAMSIGFKHSVVETSKTHIQQDANLIIVELSNAHRKSDSYSVKFENGQLVLKTCDETGCAPFERVIDKNYDYNGTSINGVVYTGTVFAEQIILPKEQHHPVNLKLTSGKNSISIDTVLTRIITGMYKGGHKNEAF
ncbi:prepilin-type N-terminal cleavage/methylation domain-containing protein [Planomicrobium stackebrandtii]|uniref:Prepilin-type N-terminal cleavage/methylation domain-containing protein n=1 Tax=Planomicrobium stackebrandtii TaxID=253160 RepID=A0ABU0GYN7_9BACL|nr:type II secretion system protein [Planomicrobium stackebrandtii]MDQ0429921.1 prepilin-type N-terminal cleavage/methylation domain-containing protein [Planomicrobium stackebrandtii]